MIDLERIEMRLGDFIRFIKEQKHGVMFLNSFLDRQLEDYLEKIRGLESTVRDEDV